MVLALDIAVIPPAAESNVLGVPCLAQTGGCGLLSASAGLLDQCALPLVPHAPSDSCQLPSTPNQHLGVSTPVVYRDWPTNLSYEAPVQCQTQSRTQISVNAEVKSTEKVRGQAVCS